MATLKKIKVQFFWADESVWMEDHQKKVSKTLVDWANAFYKDYGFVLDVMPKSIDSLAKAKPYCLAKSNGVRPEIDFYERMIKERNWEIAQVEEKMKKVQNEVDEIIRKRDELIAENAALHAELRALPDSMHEAKMALYEKMSELHDRTMALYDAVAKKKEEEVPFREEIERIRDKYEKMMVDDDHETKLRKVLMQKFDVDDIGDTDRVSIVFCKFKTGDTMLTMRKKHPGYGITHLRHNFYFHNGSFMWYYPFIVVNIEPSERITIAHELVHAAGRGHPDAKEVIKDLEKYFDYKPKIKFGSLHTILSSAYESYIEYQSLFEVRAGGYFHGLPNDVMNYNSKGLAPDKVVLHEDDQDLLMKAYFVE